MTKRVRAVRGEMPQGYNHLAGQAEPKEDRMTWSQFLHFEIVLTVRCALASIALVSLWWIAQEPT